MRRVLLALAGAALLLAACTGIFFDKGNAFPCDFNAGLGVRDAVCVPGDVCGTDNLCRPYFYEGPRFEGPARLPAFEASEFIKLHPLTLDRPITFLARAPSATPGPLMAGLEDGRFVTSVEKGLRASLNPPTVGLRDAVYFFGEFGAANRAAEVVGGVRVNVMPNAGPLSYFSALDGGASVSDTMGDNARSFRVTPPFNKGAPWVQGVQPAMGPNGKPVAGEVGLLLPDTSLHFTKLYELPEDAGAVDVGVLMRGAVSGPIPAGANAPPVEPVILSPAALWVAREDGGFEKEPGGPWATNSQLRFNGPGTVLAIESGNVLSTWQIGLTAGVHTLQQAWPDCTPCRDATLKRATPLPPAEGLGVEVFCVGQPEPNSSEIPVGLFRVTGSNAVVAGDACLVEPLTLPIDPKQLSIGAIGSLGLVSAAGQRGVAVGGRHGQVWAGETLSTLLPLTLERVPLDVTTATVVADGQTSKRLVAITDRYAALNQPPLTGLLPAGFRRLDEDADFAGKTSVQLFAAIHGGEGWGVQRDGALLFVELDEASDRKANVRYGPKLVTPTGAPIERSIGGEMFNGPDGGPVSMVIAADDSIYFFEVPETLPKDQPRDELTPQLQPEPSVPIRSLALERTPLGTDGVSRARGYLVTSRSVFEWTFGGTPARWTSRPLVVAEGEALEVWFDTSRSALGRVGYSDGRVFTLPGGHQLALPIPGDDAGTVLNVVDYENFGGWPVALATNGLFIARWDTDPNGKLLNKFSDGGVNRPMEWREITLPDGSRPWARGNKTRGKLFTSSERLDDAGTEFKLNVFLDDAVFQVGAFTR